MGWNQRNARFYCEVESQRARKEVLLGSADSGIDITVAGEYGSLFIRVWAREDDEHRGRKLTKRRIDRFSVEFRPWRSCDDKNKSGMTIAEGTLDFDAHKMNDTMVRLSDEILEMFQLTRAKEVMLQKD